MSEPMYPLGLRLAGRKVLVVGGGAVATRRLPGLLATGAQVILVSPGITPAIRALADAGKLRWHSRRFTEADLTDVWLVQVAVDDPAAAASVSDAAARRRIFCVRADDRTAATAWTPAVTRHGPITVAVLGGGDPRRAVAVRDAVRDGLSSGALGQAATAAATGSTGASPAITGPAATGPAAGGSAVAGIAAESAAGTPYRSRTGRVALVGAGPGDPELITVRGRRLLTEADVVITDRLAIGPILDELRPDAELIDASKIPYGPGRAQQEINNLLVARAQAGAAVVRLKGGDPYVFGRGGEEALACAAAGLPVTVVPGVTSAAAVPAAAGIPLTHRGVAHEFVVVSGHLPPEHPESLVDWPALGRLRGTLVVLMGLRQLPAIVAALISHGRAPGTPAAVVADGTTASQQVVRSSLVRLPAAAADLRPPAVVVIGEVAAADLPADLGLIQPEMSDSGLDNS